MTNGGYTNPVPEEDIAIAILAMVQAGGGIEAIFPIAKAIDEVIAGQARATAMMALISVLKSCVEELDDPLIKAAAKRAIQVTFQ